MKRILTLIALSCATALSANAEVQINGFANLVTGQASAGDTIYGYEDSFTFDQDSMFAVQITDQINDKASATVQIVSRGENDYETEFTWAYMTYELASNTNISGGRFRVPLFKHSSSLDVGYSYHWIQPPDGTYNVVFNNIEGIRLDHSAYVGDWEYRAQVLAGSFDRVVISSITGAETQSDIKDILTGSLELQYDWFTTRALYARGTTTFPLAAFEPLLDSITQAGFSDFAELLRVDGDTGVFVAFGADIDMQNWFVGMEYTTNDTENSFAPKIETYYVTGGIRLGAFTPHLTYEKYDASTPKFIDEALALPDPLSSVVAGTLSAIVSERSTFTLGLRYDIDANMALKTELIQQQNDLTDEDDVTLLRFAVNYIF